MSGCIFVLLLAFFAAVTFGDQQKYSSCDDSDSDVHDVEQKSRSQSSSSKEEAVRMNLWTRGEFDLDSNKLALFAKILRAGPISMTRAKVYADLVRGGDLSTPCSDEEQLKQKIDELGKKFGPKFFEAIDNNIRDHAKDCAASCEIYYCANPDEPRGPSIESLLGDTLIKSYSMGPVPPEDFAESFGFPLDIIKVTQNAPLFPPEEARKVIDDAEDEGVDKNEFVSGKYKLAGDWLTNLPNTRAWFNEKLETTLFPLLAHLFPEIVSSPSVLRAHSVSLLKYNASHPRTDVHIDNGILAMTLAMSPKSDYSGGGTKFEHMGNDILSMDVGHATLRPGSVRHGGHPVTDGTRYILGAFLLLDDKVEHVRRLKNRGSELRRAQDLDGAAEHFSWALALNPKCTTCLKDWAEVLHAQKRFTEAEEKVRKALELLENKDSDALFTLGIILSDQGRDDESIQAYTDSINLNADDAELCYNLGLKLGQKGKKKEEIKMYVKATKADPKFGGAWLNWGTALAEEGNLDDVSMLCNH
jgi:tetratricopeptide (TPR) repeat protein